MDKYKVLRYYRDENKRTEVVARGYSLAQAKNHCRMRCTQCDDWFDGFTKEGQ